MIQVAYTDRAKQDSQSFPALQTATDILNEVVGQSPDPVTAEWDKTTDSLGRPVFVLRLSDWSGSATKIFAPDDLKPDNVLWARMYSLWGDLLQIRNHRLLKEMKEMATTAIGEG